MNPQLSIFDEEITSAPVRSRGIQGLKEVEWDFEDRGRERASLHGLHPYPAKFISEIPGAILDNLPLAREAAVLDPFVGSGTTLVESQRRGYKSVGIDLNPIACLISRVKTGPVPKGIDRAIKAVTSRAMRASAFDRPDIPNLDHWFNSASQEAIAKLLRAFSDAAPECQDFLRLTLSSILVRVSNQESDTRYAAINKAVDAQTVYSLFSAAAARNLAALRGRDYALTQAEIIEHDALAFRTENLTTPIGAVVTSPPYPNAYEYWLYHKYRMWWLGYDPLEVKRQEIGARAHFFKSNAHTGEDFVAQMQSLFSIISAVLIPEGYAAFVVGRSKIHGQVIDNANVIEEVASAYGFNLYFKTERIIASNRKSFNLSHANIKTETVLVLRRS